MAITWGSVRRAPTHRKRDDLSFRSYVAAATNPAGLLHGFAPGCWSVRTVPGFYSLEHAWRELSADTEWRSPFMTWEFGAEWFEHFVRGGGIDAVTGDFRIIVAVDERRRLIGLAPMFEKKALGKRALGLILQPFGRSGDFETMTDEPIVLLRRRSEDCAMAMIVGHLVDEAYVAPWDVATLRRHGSPTRAGSPLVSFPPGLDHVELTRQVDGPVVVELPSSFERFRAGLTKSMRDNIAYYPKRLSREIGDWSVQMARSPDEVAVATDQLVDLHRQRSSWAQGLQHRSHIQGHLEAKFLTRWFHRLALRGEVILASLVVREQVAAIQAFVELGESLAVYYSGQAELWRRYSPITVIMTEVVRKAIERGSRRLMFAPGYKPWKTRWGTCVAPRVEETSIYKTGVPQLVRGLFRRLQGATSSR